MKFTVTIELVGAAMKTPADVAAALQKTAEKVVALAHPVQKGEGGRVMDHNGNHVGDWRFR